MKSLFDGTYTAAITKICLVDGILESSDLQIPDDYYQYSNPFFRDALELILLSDKVSLTMCDPGVNYDKLIQTGFFDVESYVSKSDDEWENRKALISKKSTKADIDFYKPIIIAHLLDFFKSIDYEKYFLKRKVNLKPFIEMSIDF